MERSVSAAEFAEMSVKAEKLENLQKDEKIIPEKSQKSEKLREIDSQKRIDLEIFESAGQGIEEKRALRKEQRSRSKRKTTESHNIA